MPRRCLRGLDSAMLSLPTRGGRNLHASTLFSRMLRARAVPILLAVSLTLLTGAWVIANPPSAAPDEVVHYIKALGAGGGQLVGKAPPARMHAVVSSETSALIRSGEPATSAVKIATWQWRTSRVFTVPASSLSTGFNCNEQQEAVSWECLAAGRPTPRTSTEFLSYVGTYPPFVYVPSGLLARASSNPDTKLLLGRAGMAALSLILLIAAMMVLWEQETGLLSLVGFLLAVTPMVVFISSALTASGPEVASGICFAAALIRLSRSPRPSRWFWATFVFSGIVLALSRELGPEFIVMQLLATALVLGWRRIPSVFRCRRAAVASIMVVLACVIGVYWDLHFNVHPPLSVGAILAVIPSSIKEFAAITRQEIGDFGVLDSPLPWPAYLIWLILLGVVLVLAVRVSQRAVAKRFTLLVVAVVACTVLLTASQRQTGFSFQGRYVLPIFVLVPLWAGELVRRNAARVSVPTSARLVVGITGLVGTIQALAWYANGRRVAVGIDGSWLYAFTHGWQPPLGWIPWTGIVLISLALYAVAARWGGPASDLSPSRATATGHPATSSQSHAASAAWLRDGRSAATQTLQGAD